MLSASMIIISCKGDKGDLGPQGPQGAQGQQGSAGQNGQTTLTKTTNLTIGSAECPHGGTKIEVGLDANNNGVLDASEVIGSQTKVVCNGAPGTANVYYSGWLEVKDVNWVETGREIEVSVFHTDYDSWDGRTYQFSFHDDTIISYKAEIPTPRVTQQILDQGAVLYYFKDMTTPSNGKVYPYEPWDNLTVGVTNHTAISNLNSLFSFGILPYSSTGGYGSITPEKLTIQTSWNGSGAYHDARLNRYNRHKSHYQPNRYLYNDLKPKTNFAIRYIVIPGGITGKNTPPIDLKNYEAVKKYYNIKD
jgi:hypothetical protein